MKQIDSKKSMAALSRASHTAPFTLRASGGEEISAAKRDELLAKCAAGEYVECELDVLSFEQKAGVQNRNFVRFRDGAMAALARSGVGTPFMRDHEQNDMLARGGTVIASKAEKRGEGDYAIMQTVKLTAPWAVELAIRGLLSTVSIGWDPTGPVQCSVCNLNFYRCSHYPGERYSMREMDDGSRRPVADAAGPLVCERIYTSADLVETSAVPVPAVPSAQIEMIRASLGSINRGEEPQELAMNPKILALLGLAATAGDPEIEKAIESLASAKKLVEQQRDELAKQLAETGAKLAGYEQVLAKQAEDRFIEDGVRAGKLIPGSTFEQSLRSYHAKDADGAKALLASAPVVTPIGQQRQSGGAVPKEHTPELKAADQAIVGVGGDPSKIRANLLAAGFSAEKVEKMLADTVGGKVG